MYEIYCELRDSKGVKDADVAKATGITKSTFSDWKNGRSKPKDEKLLKIANYFEVTLDYLRTGNKSESDLTARDKRDITKDLESIMAKLSNKEDGPVSYDGENLSEESMDLFIEELEIALKRLKLINKEKYNPNKNKK